MTATRNSAWNHERRRGTALAAAVCVAMIGGGGVARATVGVWIMSVVHDCAFATDDTVRVDVMLNGTLVPVDDYTCEVSFDPGRLTFVRAERGALIPAWSTFDVNLPAASITIDAAGAVAIPVYTAGPLARLVFITTCCGSPSIQNIPLCLPALGGDLAGRATACGNVRCVPAEPGSITVETVYQGCGSVLGDTVEVDVRLENTSQPIDAGGVDIGYDPARLEYVGYRRGDLTTPWLFFGAANTVNLVRVGGFTTTPLPGGSSGVFVTLRFVATCCEGPGSPLCAQSAVDDLATLLEGCGEVVCVALKTRVSTWGYVKSLYR